MSDISYTAACPGCGQDSEWSCSPTAGPEVMRIKTVSLAMRIVCAVCGDTGVFTEEAA